MKPMTKPSTLMKRMLILESELKRFIAPKCGLQLELSFIESPTVKSSKSKSISFCHNALTIRSIHRICGIKVFDSQPTFVSSPRILCQIAADHRLMFLDQAIHASLPLFTRWHDECCGSLNRIWDIRARVHIARIVDVVRIGNKGHSSKHMIKLNAPWLCQRLYI